MCCSINSKSHKTFYTHFYTCLIQNKKEIKSQTILRAALYILVAIFSLFLHTKKEQDTVTQEIHIKKCFKSVRKKISNDVYVFAPLVDSKSLSLLLFLLLYYLFCHFTFRIDNAFKRAFSNFLGQRRNVFQM